MIRFGSRMTRENMAIPSTNGTMKRKVVSHTLTGLKRWSCHGRELPRKLYGIRTLEVCSQGTAVSQVKAIHVYDFDNTRMEFDLVQALQNTDHYQ